MTDFIGGGLDVSSRDLAGAGLGERLKRYAQWLSRCSAFDLASCAALAALVIVALWTFQNYAISNDEGVQHRYGELIIAYYKSGFTDQSLFKLDNLYLYGGLFDIAALGLAQILPVDQYELRHLLCALIGIGGIGAAAATARLIAGPRAAFFAIIALVLCGSWYGGMFNHTKGIPLAAFMAGAMYFLIRATRDLPVPRMRDVIGFGIMTGAALGIRSLSLLLIGYAGLAILLSMPRPVAGHWQERARFVMRSALWLMPAFVIAYVIMIAAWPWAALSPLNPIRGLLSFNDFHYHIRTILFGQVYEMANVPRYYVPTYIAIRLPLLTLGGTLLGLALILLPKSIGGIGGARRRELGLIAFAAIFPVVCQVITEGPAFDGCRHFLFVFPPIAILAGVGLSASIGALARLHRGTMIVWLAIITTGYTWTAGKLYHLHPYEYLYYNQLVGGLEGASRRFVTDYWVNIMPEALEELHDFLDRTEPATAKTNVYRVAVCGERVSYEEYARPNLQWIRMHDWRFADFYIAPTHMNCDRILAGKVIGRIERLGVTIGTIKDRRAVREREE
ncbi:glycosyltransferase family 39 protein [Afipia massiliensis]|uniref:Glycosyltransferase family 39 protein n=1 Tax=Afipia massiliensis TaxID=211460 RepID=A0A4U6BNI2_9BRAD|nr:glycosyltransferase family 39 protein [Afipia massiliensis]TKT70538.1 glycosyltransferase family 39 protein [Afipia massiliensis]